MNELLAILIPGGVFIIAPFIIARLLKIKLFTDSNDDGFVDGYIIGSDDDF
ncbi:MAG: hypothetical protein ACO25K_08125 [Candidatus Fonsibacter ubiquis]